MNRKRWYLWMGLCAVLLIGMTCSLQTKAAKKQDGKVADETYKIYVNRAANCVTVMSVDQEGSETPVKAFACSCGKRGHETPRGTYKTSDYAEWCYMVDGTYGRYAIRINKKIMIHSVPYEKRSSDSLEWDQYNRLGEAASLGCIRLCIGDVKWIFDHCKKGTVVVVYDDAENPGPLGKPEMADISEDDPNRNWDPTDEDDRNPWIAKQAGGITYESFDHMAYAERYADLKAAFGTDRQKLWKHYVEFGIKEGRVAETTGAALTAEVTYETFNAENYANRYADLKQAFGTDKTLLWKHYLEFGKREGRIAD